MAKKLIIVAAGNGGGDGDGDGPDTMVMKTDAVVDDGAEVLVKLAGKYGTVRIWLSIDKEPLFGDDPVLKVDQGESAVVWTAPMGGPLYLAIKCDRDTPAHLVAADASLSFD